MINHAPVTEPAVGASLTVKQLMKGAVEVSDNPAANLLLKAMGGPSAMQTFYRGIGDGSTRSDRFEPEIISRCGVMTKRRGNGLLNLLSPGLNRRLSMAVPTG